jgi:hypothetical protein
MLAEEGLGDRESLGMVQLEETDFGLRVTFHGFMEPEAMSRLLAAVRRRIAPREPFGVLTDMRHTLAFPSDTQEVIRSCFLHLKETGMERQALVLNSAIATLQAKRLAREAGILDRCRYVDAAQDPEWEKTATDWLRHGLEPYAEERK